MGFWHHPAMETQIDYRQILKSELEQRKERNDGYSLRAFAKYLDVSPSCLSEIFSGKRHLPMHKVANVLEKLGISGEVANVFQTSLRQMRGDETPQKIFPLPEIKLSVGNESIGDLKVMIEQFIAQVSTKFGTETSCGEKLNLKLDFGIYLD